jgi:hypothetical protein
VTQGFSNPWISWPVVLVDVLVLGAKFWVPLSEPIADYFFGRCDSGARGLTIDQNRIQDATLGELPIDFFPLLRCRARLRRIFFCHGPTLNQSHGIEMKFGLYTRWMRIPDKQNRDFVNSGRGNGGDDAADGLPKPATRWMPQQGSFASRIVMYALPGGDEEPGGGAEKVEGAVMNRLTDAMDSRSRRILAQDSSAHLRVYHDLAAHRHLIFCSICEPNCDWPSSFNRNIRISDVQVGHVDLSRCWQAAAVWPDDRDLLLPLAPPALAPTLWHSEMRSENEHLDARSGDEECALDRQQFQLLHVLSQHGSGLKTKWQAELQLKNHSEVRVWREGCLRVGARVVAASSPLPLSSEAKEREKFPGDMLPRVALVPHLPWGWLPKPATRWVPQFWKPLRGTWSIRSSLRDFSLVAQRKLGGLFQHPTAGWADEPGFGGQGVDRGEKQTKPKEKDPVKKASLFYGGSFVSVAIWTTAGHMKHRHEQRVRQLTQAEFSCKVKTFARRARFRSDPDHFSIPLTPAPLPVGRGEGEIPGGRLTQGSSVQAGLATLATAGLICETRFGVFKMGRHNHGWTRINTNGDFNRREPSKRRRLNHRRTRMDTD